MVKLEGVILNFESIIDKLLIVAMDLDLVDISKSMWAHPREESGV